MSILRATSLPTTRTRDHRRIHVSPCRVGGCPHPRSSPDGDSPFSRRRM